MPPLLITGTLITVCVIIRLPLDSNADSWMKLESFTLKNDTLHTITVTVSSCYQQSVTDALLSETSLRIRRKFNSDFQKRRPFVSSSTLKVFLWTSSLWIPNAIYMRESLREDLCKVQKSWVKILSFHIDFSLCPHNESNSKSKRSYVFLFFLCQMWNGIGNIEWLGILQILFEIQFVSRITGCDPTSCTPLKSERLSFIDFQSGDFNVPRGFNLKF